MCNSKICVRVTPPERSVKRKKEKGWCLILFGQKSERSEKRKTQREGEKGGKKTNVKKKRKKAKRVVQTPSPSLEKGRLSPFQFYFFINNYTCVCLLCLRERERGRVRSEQHSSLKIHAHAYRSNKGSIDLETRATPHTDIS